MPVQSLAMLGDDGRGWRSEDLDALGLEDWFRYEIVDGTLVVSPSPTGRHELVSHLVRLAIQPALPAGAFVVGPLRVRMGTSLRVPDLVVTTAADLLATAWLAPDQVRLAVEIVSPSSRTTDRITKPAQYAAAGIAHFWRVELDPLELFAYTLGGDVYREAGSWAAGEVAHLTEPFAVEIDVSALLPVS